jgi:hypothetical protein
MRVTPKEKAEELVLRYLRIDNNTKEWFNTYIAKQCALFAVDECIELHFNLESDANGIGESFKYWLEVKQEIEKL